MANDNKPEKRKPLPPLKNLIVPGQAGASMIGRTSKALTGVIGGMKPPKKKGQ